jgi:hypothetical protein
MGKYPAILTRVLLLLNFYVKITPVQNLYTKISKGWRMTVLVLIRRPGQNTIWRFARLGNESPPVYLKGDHKWHIHAKVAAL